MAQDHPLTLEALSLEKKKLQCALAKEGRNKSLDSRIPVPPPVLIKLVVRCELLPKLHVHLLPTALNDYNWHIIKARQPTSIHYRHSVISKF